MHDFSIGGRFDAGHALRIGTRDECLGYPGAEGGLKRRLKILLIDQAKLDVRRSAWRRDAQRKAGYLSRILVDDARHRVYPIDRPAADNSHANRMIETPDTEWTGANA